MEKQRKNSQLMCLQVIRIRKGFCGDGPEPRGDQLMMMGTGS